MMKTGKWSARAQQVAQWFGVDRQALHQNVHDAAQAKFAPNANASAAEIARDGAPHLQLTGGTLILLTGPSGAGKSTLLRRLRQRHRRRRRTWIDLHDVHLPHALVIDAMADAMNAGHDEPAIVAALEALSRVGLGEVWTYLRTPDQLSQGQQWRLQLALALARTQRATATPPTVRAPAVLAADEFAAPLDRVTAMVVARALRKAVTARPDLCAVCATSHHDLAAPLQPDVIVHCDFGTLTVLKGDRHE